MKNYEAIKKLLSILGFDAAAKDCNESTATEYSKWVANEFLQKVTLVNTTEHSACSSMEQWDRYVKTVALLKKLGYEVKIVAHTLQNPDSYNRVKHYTVDYQEVA